jgi:hypothetical protein
MTTDSSVSTCSRRHSRPDRNDDVVRSIRFGGVSESTAVHGILGAAMVSLLGGGPRLAIRAAGVVLQDSYRSRSSARQGRLRGLARQRGD